MTVFSMPEKHLNHRSLNRGPRSAAIHVNYVYTVKVTQYLKPSDITLTAIFPRVAREAAIKNVVLCHKKAEEPLPTSQTTQSVAITKSDLLL